MYCCFALTKPIASFTFLASTSSFRTSSVFRKIPRRAASLTSAIGRGVRRSRNDYNDFQWPDQNEIRGGNVAAKMHEDRRALPSTKTEKAFIARGRSLRTHGRQEKLSHRDIKSNRENKDRTDRHRDSSKDMSFARRTTRNEGISPFRDDKERNTEIQGPRRSSVPGSAVRVPLSVPYTTPASEFLYGIYSVEAALKSGRRKLYQLYMLERLDDSKSAEDQYIYKLALAANVPVKRVGEDWDKLLNKMSDRRPHNGYVLEASPIPQLPVVSLAKSTKEEFSFVLGHQSTEEKVVNGSQDRLPSLSRGARYPFFLMLDRILDPGNLGAIIRSATYFGVDGIVILHHGTAPFSATTLKASAGSMEYMTLLKTSNGVQFMKNSQANGWRFFAAVAPDSSSASSSAKKPTATIPTVSALKMNPCVLILGEEGNGIQPRHQKQADGIVSVERFGDPATGVESLNVSVAAGLMCERFVRGALEAKAKTEAQADGRSVREDKVF